MEISRTGFRRTRSAHQTTARRGTVLRPVLRALAIACLLPHAAAAQGNTGDQPTWVADVGVAGANVVAGGITAAVTAAIRGDDVPEAFLKGAVGGGVVFLGKRTAVERFGAAGLLGREIAGVGTSMVANGGAGRGWLEEVWLPLGPAWVQVRPEPGFRARLDLADVGTLIWAATRSELDFDLAASISNGATVFVAPRHRILADSRPVNGFARGGVVVLGGGNEDVESTQRHENVHVLQHDYLLHTVSRPLERSAWSLVTARVVPLDLGLPAYVGLAPLLRRLHENEARALQNR